MERFTSLNYYCSSSHNFSSDMKVLLFLKLVICISCASSSSYEPISRKIFCGSIQCPGDNHLYCNDWKPPHNGLLGNESIRIILTSIEKELILNTHNELRNIIATGNPDLRNLAGDYLPTTSTMHKLVWNEELEWMAGLNAETCSSDHDCPSTENFLFAGQNLAMMDRNCKQNTTEFLKESIYSWFLEYLNTPVSVIDSYSPDIIKPSSEFSIDEVRKLQEFIYPLNMLDSNMRFTTLAKDTTSKIGCALVDCGKVNSSWYLVCNYENSNMKGEETYKSKGFSPQCDKSWMFPSLCLDGSDNEESETFPTESGFKFPILDECYASGSAKVFSLGFLIYICLFFL